MLTRALALVLALATQTPAAPPPGPPPAATKTETPPTLSELDRLKLINALQAVELWSLKVQAAASELQRARGEADALLTAAQIPGWILDERLAYVRPPKPR